MSFQMSLMYWNYKAQANLEAFEVSSQRIQIVLSSKQSK